MHILYIWKLRNVYIYFQSVIFKYWMRKTVEYEDDIQEILCVFVVRKNSYIQVDWKQLVEWNVSEYTTQLLCLIFIELLKNIPWF